MQKNVNVRTYDYWTIVQESGRVTQHLNSIMLFMSTFYHIYTDVITGEVLILSVFIGALLGYIAWAYLARKYESDVVIHDRQILKSCVIFFGFLLGVCPILKTLTEDASSDTIWAYTAFLFSINLIFHDYSSFDVSFMKFSGSMSLNAAIFASVLMASRLSSVCQVFGLVSLAVIWFALFPKLRRFLRSTSKQIFIYLTLVSSLASVLLLLTISHAVGILYFVIVFTLTFLCPAMFLGLQKYKNEIRGPWDEATLVLSSTSSLTSNKSSS